ncbi:transferase [Xylariaceae sp. FL0594]|nr:transferase [Xylariaceae sp. FL0594]
MLYRITCRGSFRIILRRFKVWGSEQHPIAIAFATRVFEDITTFRIENMTQMKGRVQSTRRVFPATPPKNTTSTKLSVVDATVARFAPCGAIWFFDGAQDLGATDPALFQRIEAALSQTLDDYPHYSGHLRWATSGDVVPGDANTRFTGRPIAVYGTSDDPGVELIIVQDERELASVVPSLDERATTKRVWIASDFPQADFLPGTTLAFSNLAEYVGLPGVAVQLTAFKCGAYAVGMKLTHCLSDAICLLQFVHRWAAHTRQLFGADTSTPPGSDALAKPVFDPARLDEYARLSASATELDEARISNARSLPLHRFDWWATEAPGYPSWATASSDATKPPPEDLQKVTLSPSTHPPWPTWNLAATVEHVQVRFSAGEVGRMKSAAQETSPVQGQIVSRQDALLAHVWTLINRARLLQGSDAPVYLDITLGLRNRLSPPLPDHFVGSPILLAHVAQTGSTAATAKIGAIASSIRATMSHFTPQAVSDYLYDAAHEVSPQRLWQGFLGTQHTLVTSWARARAYEVDFRGTQQLARYVQGLMPKLDGLVQIMDLADTGDFDVSIALEKEAMHRFLSDPLLRSFDN